MRFYVVLLWALLYPQWAYGQAFEGVAAFGALNPSYPCDTLLSILDHAERPAIAVLDRTFGDDPTCLIRFIERYKDRPHLIEIHLINYPGIKNQRLEPSDPFWWMDAPTLCTRIQLEDFEILSSIDARLSYWTSALGSVLTNETHLVVSPLLEGYCGGEAYRALYAVFVKHPRWWTVSHGRRGLDFWEHHSRVTRGDYTAIANEDGIKRIDSGLFRSRNRKAFALFFWRPEVSNGLPATGRFVPYAQRRFTISPARVRELTRLINR